MPRAGGTEAQRHRERVSRGLLRYHARQRELARVRPAHVDRWLKTGVVSPELRPILEARASHVEDIVADLGGADEVTAMQRRVLDTWIQAQAVADVLFQRLMQDPAGVVSERLLTSLNTARSALVALGLHRRARDVTPSLAEYIQNRHEAAEDGPGCTISVDAGADASVVEKAGSS